jgi:pSer/pThr/pTyr-binding forkhead associated (FHA) protein
MDTASDKSVSIVLIGQPQLSDTLQSPDLDQLRQRCRLRFHLNALSEDETAEYVRHRLRVAGGNPDEIFDGESLATIYDHTNGIPRLINTLCDTAMIMAFIGGRKTVTMVSIDDALEELAWEDAPPAKAAAALDQLEVHATARLTVTKRGRRRGEYLLNTPSYVIGRSSDCSIVFQSKYLSRHHALLSRDKDGWMILDLRSTNGLTVNGRDVKFARLSDRDIIGIGEYLIRFSVHKRQETERISDEEKTKLLNELPDLT